MSHPARRAHQRRRSSHVAAAALSLAAASAAMAPAVAGAAPVDLTATFPVTCTASSGSVRTPFPGSVAVTLHATDADGGDFAPGDHLQLTESTTWTFGSEARTALLSERGPQASGSTLSFFNGRLALTGTSVTALSPDGGSVSDGFIESPQTVPASSPADAGVIGSGSGVIVTATSFNFTQAFSTFDPIDGIGQPSNINHVCVPDGNAVLGTISSASTPTPTPTPTPGPVDTHVVSTLAGSLTLKNLVKGSVPLSGGLDLTVGATGAAKGALSLADASANLKVLGVLPVTAKFRFIPTEPVVGTLGSGGALDLTAKVRIQLPSVSILGVSIVGPSGTCQTTQVATIPLESSSYSPATGGLVKGSFAIGNLSGCGLLTGLVSSLTAGAGNGIALALKTVPAPTV